MVVSPRRSTPLAGLAPVPFAEFVAAVWDARGWTTRVDGRRVVATRSDADEVLTLLTLSRRRDPWVAGIDDGVDVVVDARGTARGRRLADAAGARYLDGDDVVEMLRYALPRAEADRLLRTHVGRSMESVLARPDPWPSPLVVVAALVVVFAGATAIHLGGEPSDASSTAAPTAAASTPERTYPPGVDAVGVASAERLARAHWDAIADRSYRWVVTYRRTPVAADGDSGNQLRQTVVVENDTAFSHGRDVSPIGADSESASPISGTYADGEHVYWRESRIDGPVYSRAEVASLGYDANVFHAEGEQYVVRYLSAPRTDVVVDEDRYRVTARGAPPNLAGNVSNYTASAVVEPSGLVSRLTVTYEVQIGGTAFHIEFSSRYETGDVTLSPPSWYPEAREATVPETPTAAPSQANRSTNATTSANSSGAIP